VEEDGREGKRIDRTL
jgi:hypothetical protein